MIISKIGSLHIEKMSNNQDFYLVTDKLKLLTDGCSAAKDSDFGTRLFCKLFDRLDNKNDPDMFEENVKHTFEKILNLFGVEDKRVTKKNDYMFIVQNLLFTILACFEMEDKFIVKFLGDGYILAQNILNNISYIKLDYGSYPPYFAYNYIDEKLKPIYKKQLKFKAYEFPKKEFVNIGLASDGIEPIAFGNAVKFNDKVKFDKFLLNEANLSPERNKNQISSLLQRNSLQFFDDTTLIF